MFLRKFHSCEKCLACNNFYDFFFSSGERYDFVITADQPVGAYWIQLRGLGECGIKRAQQLAILRYARGPYQPATAAPTYDVGVPQGVVSRTVSLPTLDDFCHICRISCKNL